MPTPDRSHITAAEALAAFGTRPFTIAQAQLAGINRGRVRQAVISGQIVRSRPGIFVLPMSDPTSVAGVSNSLTAIRSAQAAFPHAAVGYESALTVHGLPVPYVEDDQIHLIASQGRYRREGNVHIHGSPLAPLDVQIVAGIPVTRPIRSAVDVARTVPLPRGLIAMDALFRRWCTDSITGNINIRQIVHDEELRERVRARLIAALKDQRGWQGIRRAAEVIQCADPASESPLESLSRGTLDQWGVPRPICGMHVQGVSGENYWADLGWPEQRVLGECDGMMKYHSPDTLRTEKRRQEALEQAGWMVVRWTWDEIVQSPKVVAMRLKSALRRDPPHLPR